MCKRNCLIAHIWFFLRWLFQERKEHINESPGSKKTRYNRKRKTKFFSATRWITFDPLQLTAGNNIGFYSKSFALSDMDDYTSYTSLFDQYKIKSVTLQVRLITNPDDNLMEN